MLNCKNIKFTVQLKSQKGFCFKQTLYISVLHQGVMPKHLSETNSFVSARKYNPGEYCTRRVWPCCRVSRFETGICSPLKKLLPVKPLLPLSLKFCNRVRHGKNNQYDRYFFWLCNFSDPVDKKWVRIKQPKALMWRGVKSIFSCHSFSIFTLFWVWNFYQRFPLCLQ